ncbi:MAG TPA: MFS transporter [Actinomycetota bacterium]|nr:MFS transporter [Actinomycetota bacterium]
MRRNLRELPAAAWFLVAGNFINWFASFAIVFLVLYLTRRGFTVAQAGTAVAAYGLGEMLAGGLAGHLADRLGRRTTMAVSMFSGAATVMALYFVQPYPAIVAMAFLAGVATETWRPASRALMADLVPEGQRVTAFATVRLAGNLGAAAGSAAAGFLADHSFLWVFLSDALTSTIFGLIAVFLLPRGRRTRREEEVETGGYRAVFRDPPFLAFLVGTMLVAFVYFQSQATLPLHVVHELGLANADFGLLLSLNGILVVLFELPVSSLTMRFSPRPMISLGFLLVGLGFGLTAVADSMPLLLLTVAIWTLGEMVAAPVSYAYVADVAPEHLRGRYQGAYGIFFGSASIVGPALGTFVFSRAPTTFWAGCALLGAVAAALPVLGRPRRRALTLHPGPAGPPAGAAEPGAVDADADP